MIVVTAFLATGCSGASSSSDEDGDDDGGTGPGGSSGAAASGGTLTGGTGGTTSGGSSGTSTGGTGGTAAGSACNDVQAPTNEVSLLLDPTTNPAPQGGAIMPGLYRLESITYYGTTDPTCLDTFEGLDIGYSILVVPDSMSGGTFQMVLVASGTEVRVTLEYAIDGVTLLTSIVCGQGSTDATPYSADATTLTLFSSASGTCGWRGDVLRRE
jgi:hypothetical protein